MAVTRMLHYRRDIDGLRALAIVPVVLFHAGIPAFRGGFIGVDVFLVLSGYLITNQLLETKARGWRLLLDFYERRVRRIAPALLAMLAAVLLVVTIFLPSVDVLRTAKTTVATIFFAANFRFYGKTGYFDDVANDEPLLHTWSLAIEEQFYLFFPLLFIFLGSKIRLLVLVVLAIASLFAAQLSLARDPAWAFYLLPARAWELLAGALLATVTASGTVRRGLRDGHREVAATIGLLLILGSIATYDTFTTIPGIAALPPVIGVVLLIAFGEGSFVGKLLSSTILVWIGLISYSLYLWHWPIFVVSRQLFGTADAVTTAAIIALSFALAFLSFRYLERPFRDRASVSWKRVFGVLGAAALAILASSIALLATVGWPQRSPAAEHYYQDASRVESAFQASPCLSHDTELPPLNRCLLGSRGSPVEGILWGDSHAAHWAPMVKSVAAWGQLNFRQMTKAGCPPIPTRKMFPADSSRLQCPEFNAKVEQYILANPDLRYVVLAANWQGMTEGSIRMGSKGSAEDLQSSLKSAQDALERLAVTLRQHGKTVLIIGQTPIPDQNVILCQTRRRYLGLSDTACDRFSVNRARARDLAAQKLFKGAVANGKAETLSPFDLFCSEYSCEATEDGAPLYIDSAHLSPAGARRLEHNFATLLFGADNAPNR